MLLPRRAALSCAVFLFLAAAEANAGPIYVYKERDGTVRFTTKSPPSGVQAEVFTAKGSYSRMSPRGRWRPSRLFRSEFTPYISQAASAHKIDPHLIRAVIHAESAFNPRAVSPKGAQGLMQLMPEVAKRLGVRNSFDPEQNIRGGSRYLAFLLRKYDGNLKLALAAYNAGEGAVQKYRGVPPYAETREYVVRVAELLERYRKAG